MPVDSGHFTQPEIMSITASAKDLGFLWGHHISERIMATFDLRMSTFFPQFDVDYHHLCQRDNVIYYPNEPPY